MWIPAALGLIVAAAAPADVELRVIDSLSSGDPMVAAFGSRPGQLYVGEGTGLMELVLSEEGELESARRASLPGCPLDVESTVFGVFLACGRQGLAVVEPRSMRAAALWQVSGAVCTDVTSDGVHGFALFSLRGTHVVQVFDLATLAPVRRIEADGGGAFALAAHGGDLFVARGKDGVTAHRGVLPASRPVRSETLPKVPLLDARDLDVARGVLWIAGGAAGLVDVRLWGQHPPRQMPMVIDGRRRFAVRVSAHGSRLAVGTQSFDVAVADGHPYGHLGPFGIDLTPGAVNRRLIGPMAKTDVVRLFQFLPRSSSMARLRDIEVPPGAYRTVRLRGDQLLLQRPGIGVTLRTLEGEVVLRRRGIPGVSPIDGAPVPGEDRVIVGFDTLGGTSAGHLDGALAGKLLRGVPGPREEHNGQMFDAGWVSALGEPVMVVGGWFRPTVIWPRSGRRAPLDLPADGTGRRGHTYIHSAMVGPAYVAISRVGADTGLLVYRTADLERQDEEGFNARPVALADVSGGAALELWRTAAVELDGGAWLLISAAGRSTDSRARVLGHLFDGETLERAFDWEGPADGAGAISVATLALDGRQVAFISSLGGTVDALDVSDPSAVRSVGHVRLESDPWDGSELALIDCAVMPGGGGTAPQLLVASGRAGLARIPLPVELGSGELDLDPDQMIPLPGWTTGVVLLPDGRRVLACSQKGGATLLELAR